MKKLLLWIALIVGTVVLLGSCAEKDESTTAAAAAGNVAGSGTTASGTIEGNSDLTGTFHLLWAGAKPSGGCIDNTTAIQAFTFPAETLGFKKAIIITSTSTYTESVVTYSDATCSTMTSYFNTMLKTVTIGSELTGLTAGSAPAKPTTANKISYLRDKYALMANTTDMIAHFLSTYGVQLDSGTEFAVDESSTSTNYNLIATETVAGSKLLFYDTARQTDNFTDWSNSAIPYWQ